MLTAFRILALPATLCLALAAPATAQPHGFEPTPLLRTSLSGDSTRVVVLASARFAPGGTTGRHRHPGDEYATVLEGVLEVRVEGRDPYRVRAGEVYHTPRDLVHETVNVGEGPARVTSTFVLDRGRPLVEPAE